jgi:hypothetical protein
MGRRRGARGGVQWRGVDAAFAGSLLPRGLWGEGEGARSPEGWAKLYRQGGQSSSSFVSIGYGRLPRVGCFPLCCKASLSISWSWVALACGVQGLVEGWLVEVRRYRSQQEAVRLIEFNLPGACERDARPPLAFASPCFSISCRMNLLMALLAWMII